MFDPTYTTRKSHRRRGAVLPMFALMLPVILLLCGFAINLAYMQLVNTQMKVSTDVTSHAAGRAMSEAQRTIVQNLSAAQRRQRIVDETYETVAMASKWNLVGGRELNVGLNDNDVHFGYSTRPANGMYEFTKVPVQEIIDGTHRASSIGIVGNVNIPLAFQTMQTISSFSPNRRSVSTQVDRDIALVLDRSGSMLAYKDTVDLDETLEELYNDIVQKRRKRYYWYRGVRYWYWEYYNERRISESDYLAALGYYWQYGVRYQDDLYRRVFSSDVRTELNDLYGRTGEQAHREIFEYAYDWEAYRTTWANGFKTQSPRHSRWSFLALGVEKFLDVLGGTVDGATSGTDQKELVSLVTFEANARVDTALTDDDTSNGGIAFYQNIRDLVNDTVPLGGTGIGRGLQTGLPPIVDPDWASNNTDPDGNSFSNAASARPFAEKTIIVLTDGQSNQGIDPVQATQGIITDNPVTIHTVTFTMGADQAPMQEVARIGGGSHYHADSGDVLVGIFIEVANNLPTILTE